MYDGQAVNTHLYVDTQQLMGSLIDGFEQVEQVAENQYLFTVGNHHVLIAWGSGPIVGLSGTVQVTDLHGNIQTMDASAVTLGVQPVFVEAQP